MPMKSKNVNKDQTKIIKEVLQDKLYKAHAELTSPEEKSYAEQLRLANIFNNCDILLRAVEEGNLCVTIK